MAVAMRWLLILVALIAGPALAQARPNAIQPELVVRGAAGPGTGTELAIVMHTTPGWHGYWKNPGDAGLPMKVEWDLPDGWTVGALRYPVPSRLLVAGLVNYVYESDYAVLARLVPPKDVTGSWPIRARMQWLACTDRVCVPERGEVGLSVPTDGNAAPDPRFDDWLRALPRPLAAPARFALDGRTLRLGIPLPASVALPAPYFYPAEDGPVDYAGEQRIHRDGDRLIVELARRRGEPRTLSGVLAFGDGTGLDIRAMPGPVPKPRETGTTLGVWGAIVGAIIGGLILNLMPCVFPILAVKAMHLARAGGDERHARRDALGYAAGAVLGTGALGALLLVLRAAGVAAGWAFQLQEPRVVLVLLLLAVAMTLNLLRYFELPAIGGEAHPAGSFGTGALAAFVATPCAGPFLGTALGAALLLPTAGAVAVFAALGLGLALPFLAIAFVPALRSRLPRPGPWMARLQRILAVPMALTAVACLWLLYRLAGPKALLIGAFAACLLAFLLASLGRLQRRGWSRGGVIGAVALGLAAGAVAAMPRPGAAPVVRASSLGAPWSEAAVASALKAGHPVFVDFTADWCLTCKVNEAAAIDRADTEAAFAKAGVVSLVGDWTNGDPAITRLLESRGRAGVPLYLWYEPGRPEPHELPQLLTQAMLTERARRSR